jgi:hypothetical protein
MYVARGMDNSEIRREMALREIFTERLRYFTKIKLSKQIHKNSIYKNKDIKSGLSTDFTK